jgi:hypothetical protein
LTAGTIGGGIGPTVFIEEVYMRFRALAFGACVASCVVFAPFPADAATGGADPLPVSAAAVPSELVTETQGDNQRSVEVPEGIVDAPTISFIDSPTATCYQPDPAVDECFINWYYMSVTASPSYIINMWVTLNGIGGLAIYQGVFQTSMYVPYNMHDRGFKVACGPLVVSPDPTVSPDHGNSYAYTIRARDSAGLGSANYGTVYCPAFTP